MERRPPLPIPPTREQVLRVTANSCMALYHEYRSLRDREADDEITQRFLLERVRLVVTLPARLNDDRLEDKPLADVDMRFVQDLADHGMRILEGIELGLREPGLDMFLVDPGRGVKMGDPTVLDEFIERAFPAAAEPN